MKAGLWMAGLCMVGFIVGRPLYWHLAERSSSSPSASFHHRTSLSCPRCECDCSSEPLLSLVDGEIIYNNSLHLSKFRSSSSSRFHSLPFLFTFCLWNHNLFVSNADTLFGGKKSRKSFKLSGMGLLRTRRGIQAQILTHIRSSYISFVRVYKPLHHSWYRGKVEIWTRLAASSEAKTCLHLHRA